MMISGIILEKYWRKKLSLPNKIENPVLFESALKVYSFDKVEVCDATEV